MRQSEGADTNASEPMRKYREWRGRVLMPGAGWHLHRRARAKPEWWSSLPRGGKRDDGCTFRVPPTSLSDE